MPWPGREPCPDRSSSATLQHIPHHSNMYSLKYVIVLTLCETFNSRGDDWYPASKRTHFGRDSNFDHTQRFTPHHIKIYKNEGILEELYSPNEPNFQHTRDVPEINQRNNTQMTQHIIGTSSVYIGSNPSNRTRKPVQVNYNNTINVINMLQKNKHKRKIIKRRCPTKRFRQTKKLSSNKAASAKFLEVFEVVQFENIACISSSGLEGICLHEYECESSGGSTMGTCADGYGTCCVTQFLCDGQSSEAMGWFTNPGYPSPSADRLSCTFTLNKASEDVTQIRLDFATFELLGPNAGTCQQDQFVVAGQNTNSFIPILCGINTGQHVYIEVGDIEGPIYMSVQTISPENRLYSIKVTQLTSTDVLAAPTGCLQYFTEGEGILESFNYRDKSEIGIPRVPSYLNNLNYAMCIRRSPETCSVTYTNADYMQIVNYDTDGLPVIPRGQAGVEIFNCPGDWLLISAIRLCGERLNDGAVLQDFSLDAPVTDSNAGPLAVWFRTDEGYAGRGFKLQYQQNSCNGPP